MNMYQVKITETLTMTVEIKAETESSAEQQIKDRWKNSEYILGSDHFSDVTFEVVDTDDDTIIFFNIQGENDRSTWNQYLEYLIDWVKSHIEVQHRGMSPAGFDEWYDNEYQEESE